MILGKKKNAETRTEDRLRAAACLAPPRRRAPRVIHVALLLSRESPQPAAAPGRACGRPALTPADGTGPGAERRRGRPGGNGRGRA